MADRLTIARPYARAAFEEARGEQRLNEGSDSLKVAASAVRDERVANLLGNPHVHPDELAAFLTGISGPKLGEHGANFVRTLAENHRLAYLPEISALFDELKEEAEKIVDVTRSSADRRARSELRAHARRKSPARLPSRDLGAVRRAERRS